MKAIQITKENQSKLAGDFCVLDDLNNVIPVGYFVVVDFGVEEHFETVTTETLAALFNRTGVFLKNNWFEITKK